MFLDFLNDVFLLNFSLKTAKCVFNRFAFLHSDFSQCLYTPNLPLIADDHYPALGALESIRVRLEPVIWSGSRPSDTSAFW